VSELCCHPTVPCSFLEQRAAATAVQAAWRGHAVRQQQAQLAAAATVLQAAYRGRAVRQLLAESAGFATFLQACYRCQRARSAFLRLRAATVVLQAAWRGRQVRSRWVAGLDPLVLWCCVHRVTPASIANGMGGLIFGVLVAGCYVQATTPRSLWCWPQDRQS
jgi:hypothetical protein